MITQCSVEGCENEATLQYVWAWGEEGYACASHRSLLESQSVQVNRPISIAPISGGERQVERVGPDVEAVLKRVVELEKANADLLEQNRQLTAQLGEANLALRKANLGLDQPERPTEAESVVESATPVETRKRR
jgi:hypothetical protein